MRDRALSLSGVIDGERAAVLAYVDDLLITGESDATIYKVIERLKSVVKIKVTADLNRDRIIIFLADKSSGVRQKNRSPSAWTPRIIGGLGLGT